MSGHTSRGDSLLRAYLLFIAVGLMPIALSYGINPAAVLPKVLDIRVESTDQTQIFRALMCLYLGCAVFWVTAAFKPAWQRTAVIWGVFFMFSLAIGRIISLIADGPASSLLNLYLAAEIFAGVLGLIVLRYCRKSAS
jgi:hypothetical protein